MAERTKKAKPLSLEERFFDNNLPKGETETFSQAFLETFSTPFRIPSTLRRLSYIKKSAEGHALPAFSGVMLAGYVWVSALDETLKLVGRGDYTIPLLCGGLIAYSNWRSSKYERNIKINMR